VEPRSRQGLGRAVQQHQGTPGRDPLVHADRPFGEWNSSASSMVGERTTVYLNGKISWWTTPGWRTSGTRNLPKGPAASASCRCSSKARSSSRRTGEICLRNVYVREIPPAARTRSCAGTAPAGFESVSTARTSPAGRAAGQLRGQGRAIVCRPKKGGTIFTKAEYGDFVAGGLSTACRRRQQRAGDPLPGKGQPSADAMCEVQILDDTAAKYAKLDPRQYNGSAYGMVPAQRGYLRPVPVSGTSWR